MLTELRISGLALLQDCSLDLGPGLTAITGETGAGKTMLLTALRLLTGGRADPKIITAGRTRTEVDALIAVPTMMATTLEEAGFGVEEDEIPFSRTVLPGRSRAAISGRPVPAKMLQDTAGDLIAIHGQADQWRLKSASHQRALLDAFAPPPHRALLEAYAASWDNATALRRRVAELEEGKDKREVELRYLKEVCAEVESLEPVAEEEDLLDASIERLSNVEQLRISATSALTVLSGPDDASFAVDSMGAADAMAEVAEVLRRATDLDSDLHGLAERARSLDAEVAALAEDLRDYTTILFDDPQELARLHDRRAALTDLCRGRARNASELLQWTADAKVRIAELESEQADPEAARRALSEAEGVLQKAASQLTASRRRAAEVLAQAVNGELAELALRNAALIVDVSTGEYGPTGADRVQMLLRPHPSTPATPLGEGASGGELSRIMLALEVVLAADEEPQTMVFDEVDAGIGGLTAGQVGRRLKRLSQFHQVIVVTHLPQVAALADANFVVRKSDGNAVVSEVRGEARTEEIVRMLGGDDGTGAARRHALELESQASVAQSNA